ncbi:MAG: hypothetical protein E7174_00340 [Firmicutes bacterium]|nr:hypothetical protein [Bacillota bacterium]
MRKNKKIVVIALLLFVVLGMGVGYSILSKQLKIEGSATIDSDFNVEITGIERLDNDGTFFSGGKGAGEIFITGDVAEIEKPSYTSDTANFNVRLGLDTSITYLVTIENKGSIAAVFDNIDIVKNGSTDITLDTPIDLTNVTLSPGENVKYIVNLSYNYSDALSGETTSDISITFNTQQVIDEEINSAQPYIVFGTDHRDESFEIEVINLPEGVTYGENCHLYMSVDDGEYEKVSYQVYTQGESYYNNYYNSNNISFTPGDNLKDGNLHSLEFVIASDESNYIQFASNEITLSYFVY